MVERTCSKCKVVLSPDNASPTAIAKGGYCRTCANAYHRKWEDKNFPKCECGAKIRTKGDDRCGRCRRIAQQAALPPRPQLKCRNCGKPYEYRENRPHHCSAVCQRDMRRRELDRTRSCRWCHQVYRGRISDYCSSDCLNRGKAHLATWHAPNQCRLPVCVDCNSYYAPPNYEGYRCSTCRDAYVLTRRAVRQGASSNGDKITLKALRLRDGGICHICRRRVPKSTKTRARQGSVDHLIPIADGGTHTWDNVALAHLGCNSKRGVHGPAQLRMPYDGGAAALFGLSA